jgi:hypothetical protein
LLRTIRLVLARDSTGSVEAAEVFRRARDAADRGRSALTPEEARDLATLERELLGALGPGERELVREYDRARARRVVFPFESPRVMEIVARGARALPPERLERLRELLHEAVAAGLDAEGAATTDATSDGPNLSDR